MSIDLLERGATALAELTEEVVFVGGASIVLWITDPGAPPPRPTKDVDVIIEATTRLGLHQFEARMRAGGFREDMDSRVMCRWRHRDDPDLILDAMPATAELMGFANRWQAASLPHAARRELPSGRVIRAVPPPYLLATKLEAYGGRGGGDMLSSADLEDAVALIDGREELHHEVAASADDLRAFLADRLGHLLDDPDFADAMLGFVRTEPAAEARIEQIVVPRIRALLT